jgi:hypothetical protein
MYEDMDVEDWAISDMKKWVPCFVCGPVLHEVSGYSANALREKTRSRRKHGRRYQILHVSFYYSKLMPFLTNIQATQPAL